jgi:hypothetical protein
MHAPALDAEMHVRLTIPNRRSKDLFNGVRVEGY